MKKENFFIRFLRLIGLIKSRELTDDEINKICINNQRSRLCTNIICDCCCFYRE